LRLFRVDSLLVTARGSDILAAVKGIPVGHRPGNLKGGQRTSGA
jgi:hypothetical protein